MDCLLTGQFLVAFDDLLHDFVGFWLIQFFLYFQVLFQISIATVLHDNVKTAFGIEYFMQLYDVGMLKLV